jgi:hypothetical protein
MTRQLNLTLTATKLLLQHQSASENRGETYQIRSNLRNQEPCSCHSGGAARREVTRARDASCASGGSPPFPLPGVRSLSGRGEKGRVMATDTAGTIARLGTPH